jgi:hypothetical protein
LLRKLGETGFFFAHTWHRVPDSVFDETHLEEAEFFVHLRTRKRQTCPKERTGRYRFEQH